MERTPQLSRVAQTMRPGVFAVLEARIAEATARGTRIVPLHIGDTCRPPPEGGRFSSALERGGDVKILQPARRVRDLLALTRLDQVFAIHDDEAEAVRAFS